MKLKRILAAAAACFVMQAGILTQRPAADMTAEAIGSAVYFDELDASVNGGEPIRGVDISSILAIEQAGVVFYNEQGAQQDIFQTLHENGVNYIRVRVWNHPYDENGNSYGGGNCDVYTAGQIGKRAAEYGMKLLVDFHYSDFWADPGKQTVPKDWTDFPLEWKKTSIYNFTADSLRSIRDAGADIGMVQVGNETNCFFCGEDDMYNICGMFSSGCQAVRDFDADILIALHFADPSTGYFDWYAQVLDECWVDYDVFAASYYPYWHGTTENLTAVMQGIADKYDKYVMVAETAYPYTDEDGDTFGNAVSSASGDCTFRYPISVEGQAQCISDVFRAIADVGSKGIGAFYWEPAWLGVNGISWEEQSALWSKYGSGWATEYAGAYDSSATAAGGSSYDNQALFDFSGKPLESLSVFSQIYPQKVPAEPLQGELICDLIIKDAENQKNWHIEQHAQYGLPVYGDRDVLYQTLPAELIGAEMIQTACDSKNHSDDLATFRAGADITVYAAFDTRVEYLPAWLSAWTATELMIENSNGVIYRLYQKICKEGEIVTLGTNGQSDSCVGYTVFAVKTAVRGDINGDGVLSVADAVLLQRWLLHTEQPTAWKNGNLCADDVLNVLDLCMMKRMLSEQQ